MKKYILIIALLPILSFGQHNPGYMGKKFIVSYGLNLTPSVGTGIFTNQADSEDGGFKIVAKHALDFEYAFAKKFGLVLGLDAFSTYIAEDGDARIDINGSSVDYTSIENAKISSTGFSVGIKAYQSHLAPLGDNWEYRLNYRSNTVAELQTTIDSLNLPGGKFSQYGFTIGYNVNRILYDQLVLSFGINFNFNFALGDVSSDGLYLWDREFTDEEVLNDNFIGMANTRVFYRELFYLKFGVGYLF